MIKFPKTFQLGASMSAMQTEGKGITEIGKLTFDKYFEESPELFFNNVGPDVTCDITRTYKDDIKMFSEIKLDSLRTGFSWARLFPNGKDLNNDAVKFYHDYIAEYKKNNILIYMTLFHFDMPLWAHEKGGWASREVIESFKNYANFVFKEYGDEVDYYVTFNEPLVPVTGGYLGESHYPAIVDPKQAVEQSFGIFLAHSTVLLEYRKLNLKAPIGVVYDINQTYSLSDKPEDIAAAKLYDAYINKGPLKIMYNGEIDPIIIESLKKYNMTPKHTKEELEIISKTKVDFVGINFYFPSRIEASKNKNPNWALDETNMRIPSDAVMNPYRGWEIFPKALFDIGTMIKEEFNNVPWYIAENGMGVENEERFRNKDGQIEDNYRIEYLETHLGEIKNSIDSGSNCFGYHMWAALDCWSFRNAFKNRYGFIEVDLKDQSRKFKKSASWYKKLIENKG